MTSILELDYSDAEARILAHGLHGADTRLAYAHSGSVTGRMVGKSLASRWYKPPVVTPSRAERVRALIEDTRRMSCPRCKAQPGAPCMVRRKGHHVELTPIRRLHPERYIKAKWAKENA